MQLTLRPTFKKATTKIRKVQEVRRKLHRRTTQSEYTYVTFHQPTR